MPLIGVREDSRRRRRLGVGNGFYLSAPPRSDLLFTFLLLLASPREQTTPGAEKHETRVEEGDAPGNRGGRY